MKNVFFTFLLLTFLSCSSNDSEPTTDPNNQTKDPIIGTWNLFLGTDQVEVNDCFKRTTFTFNENQSYTQVEFKTVNSNCNEVLNVRGEWTSKGNNIYELRRHGYTSGPDIEFKFEDDNKTMILVRQTYKKK